VTSMFGFRATSVPRGMQHAQGAAACAAPRATHSARREAFLSHAQRARCHVACDRPQRHVANNMRRGAAPRGEQHATWRSARAALVASGSTASIRHGPKRDPVRTNAREFGSAAQRTAHSAAHSGSEGVDLQNVRRIGCILPQPELEHVARHLRVHKSFGADVGESRRRCGPARIRIRGNAFRSLLT
jgi:hypothetical protein